MSRREPPTKDEVDVMTRAVEAGVADDQLVRWLYTATRTAERVLLARFGRLLGHPLTLAGPAAEAVKKAVFFRYCEHGLGMDVSIARKAWAESGDEVPDPGPLVGKLTP